MEISFHSLHRDLLRISHIALTCVWSLVGLAYIFLLVGRYISTGTEFLEPYANYKTYIFGAGVVGILAIGRNLSCPQTVNVRFGFDVMTVLRFMRFARCMGLLSLMRLLLPLISSKLGPLSIRPSLPETGIWLGALYVSGLMLKITPLFIKHVVPDANELLAKDPRRPVVYFRSFAKEKRKATRLRRTVFALNRHRSPEGIYISAGSFWRGYFGSRTRLAYAIHSKRTGAFDEQMLFAEAISAIGPYIALGRAGETFQDMDLGAAKIYVSNDQWQHSVRQWLFRCSAVVLEAADSESLGWEIEQVIRMIPPTNILIICPYRCKEYDEFTHAYGKLFPSRLPTQRPRSRLLTFDKTWHPVELTNVNMEFVRTLKPFFAQVKEATEDPARFVDVTPREQLPRLLR